MVITDKTNLCDYPIILLKFFDYPDKNQPLNVEIANDIYNSLTPEELDLNEHLKNVPWKYDSTGFHFDIADSKIQDKIRRLYGR